MRRFLRAPAGALVVGILGGCSMVPTIRENTGAIVRSAEAISTNTRAVGESSATLASLEPSMTRLAQLREPMENLHGPLIQVAALGPDLDRVSALEGPLGEMAVRVTDLNGSMGALTELRASMERLAALESSMDRLSTLEEPMLRLAALGGSMEATSQLAGPLQDLQGTMEAVLALAGRPWPLLLLVGGLLWGVLTFLAVWIGVVVGIRSGSRRVPA